MSTQIYPEAGEELVKQGRERLMKAAQEARLAASIEPKAPPRRRSIRSMAYAVILVLVAGLAFATIVFASAGGAGGGGGVYDLM